MVPWGTPIDTGLDGGFNVVVSYKQFAFGEVRMKPIIHIILYAITFKFMHQNIMREYHGRKIYYKLIFYPIIISYRWISNYC